MNHNNWYKVMCIVIYLSWCDNLSVKIFTDSINVDVDADLYKYTNLFKIKIIINCYYYYYHYYYKSVEMLSSLQPPVTWERERKSLLKIYTSQSED